MKLLAETHKNRIESARKKPRHQQLSQYINALRACVYIYIRQLETGSSARLGRPRCGLSIGLSLLAISNTLF